VRRTIRASTERLFDAWTQPEQLKQWWGPAEVKTRNFTADARVGGKYRWDLVNQDGEEMTVFGEYRELISGKKIVFTWKWDDDENWKAHDSVVTIELSDRDGGTEVKLTHEKLPSEASRDRHNEGWNSVLQQVVSGGQDYGYKRSRTESGRICS
jgi:glutathione S-transferase